MPNIGQGGASGGAGAGGSYGIPLTINVPTPGAVYTITQGNITESGVVGSNGIITSTKTYLTGPAQVSLLNGGISRTDSITVVATPTVYSLQPLSPIDAGVTAASAGTLPLTSNPRIISNNNVTMPIKTNGDGSDYEFIYPDAGYGKYFTPTQVRLYIGELFIDECVGLQYVLQGNRAPVYGYASRDADAFGQGKCLVQGQLMINYISEGYLYTVLNEYKSNSLQSDPDEQAFLNLIQAQQDLSAKGTSDPAVQKQISLITKQRQQMMAKNKNLAAAYQRSMLKNSANLQGINAVYVNKAFTIEIQMEGGGRTVMNRIENCVLTSNEQIHSDQDSTIVDSYGFIGRRLR